MLASAGCVGDAPPPTSVAAPAVQVASPPAVLRLPRTFVPAAFSAQLALDPSQMTFDGSISIHGNVAEPVLLLWLHGRHLAAHLAEARPQGGGRAVPLAIVTHTDLLEVRASSPLSPGALGPLTSTTAVRFDELDTSGAFKQTVDG
jgi:hypothetical protein